VKAAASRATTRAATSGQTQVVKDDAFVAAAEAALASVPGEPYELAAGQHVVPREFLRELAVTASDWPYTAPEIWYGGIMRECFWALVRQRPIPADGDDEDEQSLAEGLAIGVLLAMTSADRGGHHAAADLCQTALAYMASLPAWRDVRIEVDAQQTRLTIDVPPVDPGASRSDDRKDAR
jgi:hypothetical protein